jgi:hypothetical protein
MPKHGKNKRPSLQYRFRNTGVVREARLDKKARLMGEIKAAKREVLNRGVLIEAMQKELVRVIFERGATAIEQAAVLQVVQRRDIGLYNELVNAYQTHADKLEMAPLVLTDSDIVIATR